MGSDKNNFHVHVEAIFYRDFYFMEEGMEQACFSCQAGIDNRSMREGEKMSFMLPESRKIEKYRMYDLVFTFSNPDEVKKRVKNNSRLYLWLGIFIGEAVVKGISDGD